MKYSSTRNLALFVLFGLLLAKRVVIEVWGRDVYREGFLLLSTVALALVLTYGVLSVWGGWKKSKHDG
ncbi:MULTISPECIES: hypothetical protein [unclassified Roseovarius]|uniref:hypothetical protein n=1 Tax=unclassified Roseovarius TaxID=2614913 RepID=UPI00273D7EB6|nr:hypothetical protein [Roseovarius sp. MMSF_3350]